MKFSELLKKANLGEHKDYYIKYSLLKNTIHSGITENEENAFLKLLTKEIKEFNEYTSMKHNELIMLCDNVNNEDENVCERIKVRLYNFSEYLRINLIGFKRIFRKHDKMSGYRISNEQKVHLKVEKSRINIIKRLISSISEERKMSSPSMKHSVTRYWIGSEDIIPLKLAIKNKLGMASKNSNNIIIDDEHMNCIYLDSDKFGMYESVINNVDECKLIRIRWIGSSTTHLFLELIENESVSSILIPEDLILQFLNGEDIWMQILNIEKNNKEIYDKIKFNIGKEPLKPIVRTFCRRASFEHNNVKIVLDSNIVMIKECLRHDFSRTDSPLTSWKNSDLSLQWPFRGLPSSDIIRFPYSVLEIHGVNEYEWLQDIICKSSVIKHDKFSKYIHGTAMLFPEVDIMPQWLSQCKSTIQNSEIISRKSADEIQVSGESEISYEMSNSTNEVNNMVSMRVEPKAFFANERTFLSWVQFAIFLGGIGTAMIGLGNIHAYLCGLMFIGMATAFALYSLYLFYSRAKKIREKDSSAYDTVVGPAILVGIFILVIMMSFVFKFPIHKKSSYYI